MPLLDLLLVITLAMDGFDDLLAPSRRAFSENPFANPFTTDRSHSPDPWASPFANTQQNVFGSSLDPYANPYEALGAPSPGKDAEGEENHTTTATSSPTTLKAEQSDPLVSAVQENDSDEPAQPLIPRESHDSLKPSFNDFNETATIRPSDPEFFDGLPTASSAQPQPVTPSPIPPETAQTSLKNQAERNQPLEDVLKSSSAGFIAHPPAHEPIPRVPEFSPLDNILDGGSGIDRSLAGLTLGGDTFAGGSSGWGGDAITAEWSTSSEPILPNSAAPSSSLQQAADDDSDDDKPISQTLSRIQSEDPDRAVCFPISEGYWC